MGINCEGLALVPETPALRTPPDGAYNADLATFALTFCDVLTDKDADRYFVALIEFYIIKMLTIVATGAYISN